MWPFSKKEASLFCLEVDVHSHLIPAIDDGVESLDETIEIITQLGKLGIRKVITTPHIIQDHYPNTREIIESGLERVRNALNERGINNVTIEAAAEYYFDDSFVKRIDSGEELMTFGKGFVLIETAFMNKPIALQEVFFQLISNGYIPVLAHPERYSYLYQNIEELVELREMGVKIQVNAFSLIGHYSQDSRLFAEQLINKGMVDFLGSDIHRPRHIILYKRMLKSSLFHKCRQLSLLNNSL